MANVRIVSVLVILLVLIGASSVIATAQTPGEPELHIQYVDMQENDAQQVLDIYFTLIDGNDVPIREPIFQTVDLTLDASTHLMPGPIVPATKELYLTLVLDTSRSMGGSGDMLKQAVIDVVEQLPENTHISIITFNQDINTVLPFTTNRVDIATAVQSITRFDGGTCLYDAAHLAVSNFHYENSAVRRAIVLFTDGKDETENSNRCSSHSLDEVVATATDYRLPVPIYTVGVYVWNNSTETQEAINTLTYIANGTGGLLYQGTPDNISQLFHQVIGHINSQWVMAVPICVSREQHPIELKIQLASYAVPLQDARTFTAQTSCFRDNTTPTPPQDISISIVGINYSETDQLITFSVQPSHAQSLLDRYIVRVLDGPIELTSFETSEATGQFTINDFSRQPTSVVIQITALDTAGNILAETASSPITITYPSTPTPEPLGLTITSLTNDSEAQRISFEVVPSHTQIVPHHYFVRIKDEWGYELWSFETFFPDISFSLSDLGQQPTSQIVRIDVVAKDEQGNTLASIIDNEIRLRPPPTPTPDPVGVQLGAVTQVEIDGQDHFFVEFTTIGGEHITNILIEAVNVTTNERDSILVDPPFEQPVYIPIRSDQASEYQIIATVQSPVPVILAPSAVSAFFTPNTDLKLSVFPDPRAQVHVITLNSNNLGDIAFFDVNFERVDLGVTVFSNPRRYATSSLVDNKLTVGIYDEGLVDGEEIRLIVQGLDANGKTITEARTSFIYFEPQIEPPPPPQNMIIRVVVFVLLAGFLIALILFLFQRRKKEKPPPVDTAAPNIPSGTPIHPPIVDVGDVSEDKETRAINMPGTRLRITSHNLYDRQLITAIEIGENEPMLAVGRPHHNPPAKFFDVVDGDTSRGDDISRQHLHISWQGGMYVVDIKGINTWSLDPNLDDSDRLHPGDQITLDFGIVNLRLGESIYVALEVIDPSLTRDLDDPNLTRAL